MFLRWFSVVLLALASVLLPLRASAASITVAAAADLKFAMDDIVTAWHQGHPDDKINLVYGSSGKFSTQIQQGAPFDLYFSADISYPQALAKAGLTASTPKAYAIGRIVLWSGSVDVSKMTLHDLAEPRFDRIAVANPEHAPYGKRAVEALHASGMWDQLKGRLVYGENIAQTAQFVQTGNARVGIIALSLALNPAFASKGGYAVIPDNLYKPLVQGYVITKHGAHNPLAHAFAHFIDSAAAKKILAHYGFAPPAATGA
jgi:molybdate transport system substrate-binding protein